MFNFFKTSKKVEISETPQTEEVPEFIDTLAVGKEIYNLKEILKNEKFERDKEKCLTLKRFLNLDESKFKITTQRTTMYTVLKIEDTQSSKHVIVYCCWSDEKPVSLKTKIGFYFYDNRAYPFDQSNYDSNIEDLCYYMYKYFGMC